MVYTPHFATAFVLIIPSDLLGLLPGCHHFVKQSVLLSCSLVWWLFKALLVDRWMGWARLARRRITLCKSASSALHPNQTRPDDDDASKQIPRRRPIYKQSGHGVDMVCPRNILCRYMDATWVFIQMEACFSRLYAVLFRWVATNLYMRATTRT
jgi:hypothetical protein